jgi:hypothetical protein
VSLLPGAYNPIQSLLVGVGIWPHATINESPADTDAGVADKVTDAAVMLNALLVALVSPEEAAERV